VVKCTTFDTAVVFNNGNAGCIKTVALRVRFIFYTEMKFSGQFLENTRRVVSETKHANHQMNMHDLPIMHPLYSLCEKNTTS
jgi:hypothetical protein